jgi:chromosome segregation ATPase
MTILMQSNENPLKSANETLKASVDTLNSEAIAKAALIEELQRKLSTSDRLATHKQNLLDQLNEDHDTVKAAASDLERKYQELEHSHGALQNEYSKSFQVVADTGLELEQKKKEIEEKDNTLTDMTTALTVQGRKYEVLEKRFQEVQQQASPEQQQLINKLRDEAHTKDREISQLKAENTNLSGKQTARENDMTKLRSEFDKVQSDLTVQRREYARQAANHADLQNAMAEKEDIIAGMSTGAPGNASTAAIQQARVQWEAEAKKKQLEGFEAYRSSKEKRLQKVIDTLGNDTPLTKRQILIDVYTQEIEEIDKHIERVKEGQSARESIENWYDGAGDPLPDVRHQ